MSEIICIVCPLGCRISVTGEVPDLKVAGQGCRRGETYARNELSESRRMVTAVVGIAGSRQLLPVKTEFPIPKEKISAAMAEIRQLQTAPPIQIGQIIKSNLAATGISLIATKNIRT